MPARRARPPLGSPRRPAPRSGPLPPARPPRRSVSRRIVSAATLSPVSLPNSRWASTKLVDAPKSINQSGAEPVTDGQGPGCVDRAPAVPTLLTMVPGPLQGDRPAPGRHRPLPPTLHPTPLRAPWTRHRPTHGTRVQARHALAEDRHQQARHRRPDRAQGCRLQGRQGFVPLRLRDPRQGLPPGLQLCDDGGGKSFKHGELPSGPPRETRRRSVSAHLTTAVQRSLSLVSFYRNWLFPCQFVPVSTPVVPAKTHHGFTAKMHHGKTDAADDAPCNSAWGTHR